MFQPGTVRLQEAGMALAEDPERSVAEDAPEGQCQHQSDQDATERSAILLHIIRLGRRIIGNAAGTICWPGCGSVTQQRQQGRIDVLAAGSAPLDTNGIVDGGILECRVGNMRRRSVSGGYGHRNYHCE